MKEQIEEMRRDLVEIFTEEYDKRNLITADNTAKKMLAKGYLKQSEGEWVWTENGEEDYEQYWVCSCCHEKSYWESKFCPECGAKMRGGAEQ